MKALVVCLLTSAAVAVLSTPVQADDIFNNLGPNDTFGNSGWDVCSGCTIDTSIGLPGEVQCRLRAGER